MKVKHYPLVTGFAVLSLSVTLFSNSNGPQAAVAGSPIEGGNNCTQCHSGTANSGSGNLEISGIDVYAPGETYTISINVNDETSSKFGFQAIAVDANDNAIGTIAAGTGSKRITSGGNDYATQNRPSADGTFTFEWTAPSSDVGEVTFYAAGNATNGNNSVSGDNVYTSTLKASATQVGIEKHLTFTEVANVSFPADGEIQINALNNAEVDIEIYNLNGQLVTQARCNQRSFALGQGVFIIKAIMNGNVYTQKISL